MASKICESVKEFLTPKVEALGVELVEVEYKKLPSGMNLTIFIDRKEGIDLNKCEEVHHVVDAALDELDPTNGHPYTLNVSSLGLDYPFKTDKDYERNIGEMVEVNLYSKLDGKKEYVGELKSFTPDEIIVVVLGKEKAINRNLISKITKYITL